MSWPIVTLDSIKADVPYSCVGGPFGSNLTSKHYVDEGVPVIRGQNLGGPGRFDENGFVFVTPEKADQLRPNLAFRGDLLFTQRGTLGQVGLIPHNSKYDRYVVSQSQMKLTVDANRVDARYVYQYFRLPSTVQKILNRTITAGVPHINLGILKAFEIPLPPLKIQQAISEVAQAYDDLIATNHRRIALLEDAARRLYREWFVHMRFPGHELVPVKDGVPKGWQAGVAHDFIAILSGGTPKTDIEHYWNGEIPFFTPKDSPSSFYVLETEKALTELGLANCNSRLFPKNATFITARGTVGKVALAQKPMAMNQSCYALAPRQDFDELFLFLAIKEAVEHFKQVANGGVFNAIVVDTFKIIPFVLPETEPTRVFGNKVRPIFQQIENLLLQNSSLSRARDVLLPKLMSGQLDVSGIRLPSELRHGRADDSYHSALEVDKKKVPAGLAA